jgi:diaminopimelate decarboxylase
MRQVYESPMISGDLGRSAEAAIDRNFYSRGAIVPPISAIDGVKVSKLVREFGSPVFVFSERDMRAKARRAKEAFGNRYKKCEFAWSYKTNSLNAVCQIFHGEGWLAEVVSDLEYEKARKLDVSGSKIIFNGPNKSRAMIERAMNDGALIQIDNWEELDLVEKCAEKRAEPTEVGIRVWLDAGIRPIWSKFGFALANGEAVRAATRVIRNRKLTLHTIHTHIGTYILAPEAYRVAAQKLVTLREHLYLEENHLVRCLNMGGGLPSNSLLHGMLRSSQLVRPVEEYAEAITSVLNTLPEKKQPLLRMELGRHAVDEAGYLLTKVVAVKAHDRPAPVSNDLSARAAKEWQILQEEAKRGLLVDAGINLLYTAAWFEIGVSPAKLFHTQVIPTRLYGSLCMAIDVIRETVDLPILDIGDILTLHPVGAYNLAQSMQFIFYKPAVVLIGDDGKPELIRRRENFDDIDRMELLPSHLSAPRRARKAVDGHDR